MKKIEAIIRKTKFEEVKDSLLEADIEWFSYYDVRGIGKRRKDSTSYHQSRTNRRNRRRPHLRHPH